MLNNTPQKNKTNPAPPEKKKTTQYSSYFNCQHGKINKLAKLNTICGIIFDRALIVCTFLNGEQCERNHVPDLEIEPHRRPRWQRRQSRARRVLYGSLEECARGLADILRDGTASGPYSAPEPG